jgi:hypothetical protein
MPLYNINNINNAPLNFDQVYLLESKYLEYDYIIKLFRLLDKLKINQDVVIEHRYEDGYTDTLIVGYRLNQYLKFRR